jgi:hypothetical protein
MRLYKLNIDVVEESLGNSGITKILIFHSDLGFEVQGNTPNGDLDVQITGEKHDIVQFLINHYGETEEFFNDHATPYIPAFHILNETEEASQNNSKRSEIYTNYNTLLRTLGEATYSVLTEDGKVNKRWVILYQGHIFTVYDYKEFDNFSLHTNLSWSVGAKYSTPGFIVTQFINLLNNNL